MKYQRTPRQLALMALLTCLLLVLAACGALPAAQTAAVTATDEQTASSVEVAENEPESAAGAEATTTQFFSDDGVARPAGWDDATHSNNVDPDYAAAFPQDTVTTFKITISPEQWQIMRDDITSILGELNEEGGMGFPGGMRPGGIFTTTMPFSGTLPFDPENLPEGFDPAQMRPGGMGGQGGPGFGGGDMIGETPTWVEATIEVDGTLWEHVGIRYKGNSSLRGSWNGDGLKLPFKLDFDEWEDDYPEIDNQRFHGVKQLSLANNFNDDADMRDALAYSAYRAAGLPAGQTTFYNVILDYGEGPIDLGLYTSNEVIDDTVIPTYFGSDDGNIYEADGTAASFAAGTRAQIPDSFEKENNEDEADWSDIEELYDVIHSDLRTTDVEAWQAQLESVIDVDSFLNWLAVSGVIGHWDTYGQMTHNYYLYNDPATGLLNWISWDHNLTLGSGGMGGQAFMRFGGQSAPDATGALPADVIMGAPGGNAQQQGGNAPRQGAGFPGGGMGGPGGRMGGQSADSTTLLARENTGEQWPLITYVLEIPEYRARYNDYVAATLVQGFESENLLATIDRWAELLAPYANAENGDDTT